MSAIDLTLSGYDLFGLGAQESPQATTPPTPSATRDNAAASEGGVAALPLNRLLYLALIENCVCAE